MFLTALAAKFCAVMTTGWAADKGMPICWAGVANSFAGGRGGVGSGGSEARDCSGGRRGAACV